MVGNGERGAVSGELPDSDNPVGVHDESVCLTLANPDDIGPHE